MTVALAPAHARAMERHAKEAYPEECCGFLLGEEGEVRLIVRVERTGNVSRGPRGVRYDIDPREILRIDREARRESLELLGFYHSHPDHPAKPSSFDTERAWPWYTYLILPVQGGVVGDVTAWRLDDAQGIFWEEKLMLTQDHKEVGR